MKQSGTRWEVWAVWGVWSVNVFRATEGLLAGAVPCHGWGCDSRMWMWILEGSCGSSAIAGRNRGSSASVPFPGMYGAYY